MVSLVGLKLKRVSSNNSQISSRSTTDESGTSLQPGIVGHEAIPSRLTIYYDRYIDLAPIMAVPP